VQQKVDLGPTVVVGKGDYRLPGGIGWHAQSWRDGPGAFGPGHEWGQGYGSAAAGLGVSVQVVLGGGVDRSPAAGLPVHEPGSCHDGGAGAGDAAVGQSAGLLMVAQPAQNVPAGEPGEDVCLFGW